MSQKESVVAAAAAPPHTKQQEQKTTNKQTNKQKLLLAHRDVPERRLDHAVALHDAKEVQQQAALLLEAGLVERVGQHGKDLAHQRQVVRLECWFGLICGFWWVFVGVICWVLLGFGWVLLGFGGFVLCGCTRTTSPETASLPPPNTHQTQQTQNNKPGGTASRTRCRQRRSACRAAGSSPCRRRCARCGARPTRSSR